ncbi:MAG: hypothetical protein V7L14_19865 [Nostoc sp.]|uniref:hypothetical protein n=1 Tax=Nostoc sp. TaxID=1180 RepID=UPI002FF9C67C
MRGLPPQDLRQSRDEVHFQPEAGNEVLKGFWLNLTPMAYRPLVAKGAHVAHPPSSSNLFVVSP